MKDLYLSWDWCMVDFSTEKKSIVTNVAVNRSISHLLTFNACRVLSDSFSRNKASYPNS